MMGLTTLLCLQSTMGGICCCFSCLFCRFVRVCFPSLVQVVSVALGWRFSVVVSRLSFFLLWPVAIYRLLLPERPLLWPWFWSVD
ncbi:hypothetical protein IWX90DRAFT_98610 [Phyllosticta citrichinensis]|uniref:Secreted peptide n=1 Tax=Phyllosticta citrichinensis TaxID=1130410 RepID=A0ABR1Y1J4_9PEZI